MASNRQWGLLCPDGHGLLVERVEWTARGVVWCPHEDHGGNGRFWRTNEAEEGWFDPTRPARVSEAQQERMQRASDRAAEWAAERQSRMATKPKAEAKPKAAKESRNCLCGCGGATKGGRFLPGHDARFHARVKALEAQGVGHAEAEQIASKGPLTGKYAIKPAAAKPAAKSANGTSTAPVTAGTVTRITPVPKPKPKAKGNSRSRKATAAEPTEAAPDATAPEGFTV